MAERLTRIDITTETVLKAIEKRGIDVGELRAKLTATENKYGKRKEYLEIDIYEYRYDKVYYTVRDEREL